MDYNRSWTSFEIFSENFLWLRKKYGISKQKMASILGIGLWTLNKIERGELPQRLTIEILFSIQKHFGITPAIQLSQRLKE